MEGPDKGVDGRQGILETGGLSDHRDELSVGVPFSRLDEEVAAVGIRQVVLESGHHAAGESHQEGDDSEADGDRGGQEGCPAFLPDKVAEGEGKKLHGVLLATSPTGWL